MPSTRPPEYLEAGCVYRCREFKQRLGIGEAGWRKLKKQGLKVHKIGGKTVLVRTDDFNAFLMSQNKQEE